MRKTLTIALCMAFIAIGISPTRGLASRIDELQQKIDERNKTIAALEEEIKLYTAQANEMGKQAKTLQTTIKTLDLNRQKLASGISITENEIDATELEIEKLSLDIGSKETSIGQNKEALAHSIRELNSGSKQSILETVLEYKSLAAMWAELDTMERFEGSVRNHVLKLESDRSVLSDAKVSTEKKKGELEGYKRKLADQKLLIEANKREKNKLLADTQNKESNFKKILAEKVALRAAFEKELRDYESQLHLAVDLSKLPSVGSGVLAWPLDVIRITQYFGNTEFAAAHTALYGYGGVGHNGVDFAAPMGTPIKAAAVGVVEGTGDTDIVCPGASYGKWVLLRHQNGLSTLYGHLSVIKVSKGDAVATGDVVGYSGSTGYSTGPHLHFTVYATQGVQIMERKSSVCRGSYIMPIADLKAYLNPLAYL